MACFPLPTTVTLIIDGRVTVDPSGAEGGGIIIATRQIWMGSMETQIMPKGSISITGKVSITQWKRSESWFENPDIESYKEFINQIWYLIFFKLKAIKIYLHVYPFLNSSV